MGVSFNLVASLNRKIICWIECLHLGGKFLLHIQLLGSSLIKIVIILYLMCNDLIYMPVIACCVCEFSLFYSIFFFTYMHIVIFLSFNQYDIGSHLRE